MSLESLPEGYRAVVFGSSGGLGSAFVKALCENRRCAQVCAVSRRDTHTATEKLSTVYFNLEDESSIVAAVDGCTQGGPLHLIVVATGMLHGESIQPEKTWASLNSESLQRAFAINTIGPALIAKHGLRHLATNGKSLFAALSARVGSIADNRLGGWYAYRASKAALNMTIRTLAIELAQRNNVALCVGLHPGTVQTALSKPFLGPLNSRRVFSPECSVERLLQVIDDLSPAQTGRLFAWDGSEIPF